MPRHAVNAHPPANAAIPFPAIRQAVRRPFFDPDADTDTVTLWRLVSMPHIGMLPKGMIQVLFEIWCIGILHAILTYTIIRGRF
jgi:hypothetical protein